jgi:peptide/nickel transport system substrate-binding protein
LCYNASAMMNKMTRLKTRKETFSPALLKITILLVLIAVVACTPVRIPTSDATPTRPVTATKAPALVPPTVQGTPAPTRAPTSVGTPIPSPTTSEGPEGGALTVGVVGTANSDVNALPAIVQSALFDSLLQIDPANGSLKPALAETYQISNDATTITFRLRSDVRFHNGDALTAEDVVATLQAFSAATFRGTPLTDFGTFTRASALDPQTVQLAFSSAYCPALASIGTLKILPRAVATSANFPRLTPAQLIGTGAFKLAARTDEQFTFERNTEYFRGAPHLDSLTVRVYADAAAARAAFAAKQIDLLPAAPGESAALQKLDAKIGASDTSEFIALMFNLDTPTLNDPRVRQALTYALDRQVLLNDIGNQARLINTSALPEYWAYPQNLPGYTFDSAKAKQLLADAGWRAPSGGDGILRQNNKPLRLELWTEADDPILEPLAFRIREQYAALGIQVELELNDRPGWITRAFEHRFDLLLLARKIPLDLDQRWYWQSDQNAKGSGFNFGSYANPHVDGALKELLRAPGCDAQIRAALSGEIYRALIPDAPVAFLFAPKKYLVARDRVLAEYLAPSPFAGDFWNLNNLRAR